MMYQLIRSWSSPIRAVRAGLNLAWLIAASGGTAIDTTDPNGEFGYAATVLAAKAPQSCPTSTASGPPSSAS